MEEIIAAIYQIGPRCPAMDRGPAQDSAGQGRP
jgi:hypothetical protein